MKCGARPECLVLVIFDALDRVYAIDGVDIHHPRLGGEVSPFKPADGLTRWRSDPFCR
jgi:hypothetical protein